MFNSYCGAFTGFFAEMVHYGIMAKEDAQCFSVQGYIEPGAVILVAAAVILIFVNTMVNKAVAQYFFDKKVELEKKLLPDVTIDEEFGGKPVKDDLSMTIHPVPVLFTDTFRWCLHRNNRLETKSSNIVGNKEGTSVGQGTSADCGISITEKEEVQTSNKAVTEKLKGGTTKSKKKKKKRVTKDICQ
jgi:hypothetical protein